jgi:hypothetical protein
VAVFRGGKQKNSRAEDLENPGPQFCLSKNRYQLEVEAGAEAESFA